MGNAISRFRFSTIGGLLPTGFATSGEVEDYALSVINPLQTWHNFDNPVDVNNQDGPSPLDALLVINELNLFTFSDPNTGILDLPATPPPYLDVNNDGFVSPLDALLVINALPSSANRPAQGIVVTSGPTAAGSSTATGGATPRAAMSVIALPQLATGEASKFAGRAAAVAAISAPRRSEHNPLDLAIRSFDAPKTSQNDIPMSSWNPRAKEHETDMLDDLFAAW